MPYTLSDMSDDGFGLLDALGIDSAHIVGASMGGMIAQTMAIEHPERVLTLTSIMSTTGEREYGQAAPEAMAALLTPPPTEREAIHRQRRRRWKVIGSPDHFDEDQTRPGGRGVYDRTFYPEGAARQMAAIVASGNRADGLQAALRARRW